MEIVIPPPQEVRWFLIGLPLAIALVMLMLKDVRPVHRILPVMLVVLSCAAIYALVLKPMRFSWDRDGISDAAFGKTRRIPWSAIREARLIRGFRSGGHALAVRTDGTYYSGYCGGHFRLANGMDVQVFVEPESADALLLATDRGTFLYAPRSFGNFTDAVRDGTGKEFLQ